MNNFIKFANILIFVLKNNYSGIFYKDDKRLSDIMFMNFLTFPFDRNVINMYSYEKNFITDLYINVYNQLICQFSKYEKSINYLMKIINFQCSSFFNRYVLSKYYLPEIRNFCDDYMDSEKYRLFCIQQKRYDYCIFIDISDSIVNEYYYNLYFNNFIFNNKVYAERFMEIFLTNAALEHIASMKKYSLILHTCCIYRTRVGIEKIKFKLATIKSCPKIVFLKLNHIFSDQFEYYNRNKFFYKLKRNGELHTIFNNF